jgi:hypothetical protein
MNGADLFRVCELMKPYLEQVEVFWPVNTEPASEPKSGPADAQIEQQDVQNSVPDAEPDDENGPMPEG